MRIVHIITGLGNGGAEGVLYRLVTNDKKNEHIVISLMDSGKYGPLLDRSDIKTYFLNLNRGKVSISALLKLKKILKNEQPDVIQTWMSHADLVGGLVARLSGFRNVVWNIRHTKVEYKKSNLKTNAVILLSMGLSKVLPKKIICCSHKTYYDYSENGYDKSKMVVISNGYDFDKFNKNVFSRDKIREELSISENESLLGMIGRYDLPKNHSGLLDALHLVKKETNDFKIALIGRDLNDSNYLIKENIEELGLMDNVILLDQRKDIPAIMNALDLHILSSSSGEGFPNVIAEAMACGTLCVATNVGDSGIIINDHGWLVEPKSSKLLADAILIALKTKQDSSKWNNMGISAQKHIIDNFSLEEMISKYNDVWQETLNTNV